MKFNASSSPSFIPFNSSAFLTMLSFLSLIYVFVSVLSKIPYLNNSLPYRFIPAFNINKSAYRTKAIHLCTGDLVSMSVIFLIVPPYLLFPILLHKKTAKTLWIFHKVFAVS